MPAISVNRGRLSVFGERPGTQGATAELSVKFSDTRAAARAAASVRWLFFAPDSAQFGDDHVVEDIGIPARLAQRLSIVLEHGLNNRRWQPEALRQQSDQPRRAAGDGFVDDVSGDLDGVDQDDRQGHVGRLPAVSRDILDGVQRGLALVREEFAALA
jgi:hypothetical protein